MVVTRADQRARRLADRHYSRQKVGSGQFTPPGRVLVLLTPEADAVWATSWPYSQYVKREWKGAWLCSLFRNESAHLSSNLICQAVAVTRWRWPIVPSEGMVTMIDTGKVRRKRDPGRCYLRAGFHRVGETVGGLVVLQLLPEDMPAPCAPIQWQLPLFEQGA
jgi:hypothetical protein